MQVNRYLKDKVMDHIDHALGRPVNPMVESYRNHFACYEGDRECAEFAASKNWRKISQQGDMIWYAVTEEGRKALAGHLKEIGDQHRTYEITFNGHTSSVVGKSAGNAKRIHWLNISDCFPDMKFIDFLRRAKVRVVPS